VLNPTPPEKMIDAQRRPYFLWDCELTIDDFRSNLDDPDLDVRAYWIGKLMRQAKPDDVFQFVTRAKIEEHWSSLERYLGWSREFWTWIFSTWKEQERAAG